MKPAFHNKYYNGFTTDELSAGAPEEIRTPDPQIRSLVLYPAELRALAPGNDKTCAVNLYPRGNARGVASKPEHLDGIPSHVWSSLSSFDRGRGVEAAAALPLRQAVTGARRGRCQGQADGHILARRSIPAGVLVGEWAAKGRSLAGNMGFHARRAPRRSLSSTARSGIVSRKVAPIVPSTSRISPPWARTSSAAMASPRPVPPARVDP